MVLRRHHPHEHDPPNPRRGLGSGSCASRALFRGASGPEFLVRRELPLQRGRCHGEGRPGRNLGGRGGSASLIERQGRIGNSPVLQMHQLRGHQQWNSRRRKPAVTTPTPRPPLQARLVPRRFAGGRRRAAPGWGLQGWVCCLGLAAFALQICGGRVARSGAREAGLGVSV